MTPRARTTATDDRIKNAGYEVVDVSTLTEYPGNPRRGDVDAIRESIQASGFIGALIVQTSTRHVLSGNHTLKALIAEGIAEVPVIWRDVDDEGAARIVLAFNRASDLGYYDNDALATLLATFDEDDLLGTLYSSADVDVLLATVNGAAEGDGIGDTRDSRTPADRAEEYGASPIRSIIIPLDVGEYEDVIARLVRLRQAWDLTTNAEVIKRALELAGGD